MKIVVIMKSKESFKRIRLQVDNNSIEWEPIFDLDDLREKIVFIKYDIALVDDNVWWANEAIELFKKFDTEIIKFEGDFEKTTQLIMQNIPSALPEDTEEKEEETKDKTPSLIHYVEKEVIKEREVKVEVPIYKEVYANIPKQLIIISNLSKRAGATFLTLNLAKALSDLKVLTSVIEIPTEPYIFDTVGLEQRMVKNFGDNYKYHSYPHEIYNNKKITKEKETILDGIVWLLPDPREPLINDFDYYKMMKLLYISKKASISILDVGYNIEKDFIKPLLDEADKIFIVIDPMPTEIMQNKNLLNKLLKLKNDGLPIEFVINRWTNFINKKELINYIKVKPITLIPAVNVEFIHKAIYNYKLPYDILEIKKEIEIPISNIIKDLVPSEFIINNNKSKSFKNKLTKLTKLIKRGE